MSPDPANPPSRPARRLQACPSCARLVDVTGLAVDVPVRCPCGRVTAVARPDPLVARALACRRCGGPFQAGATACPWCEAGIVLEDRHLAGVCGGCGTRLGADARFCPGCGTRVGAQAVTALHVDAACPRCASGLRTRALDELELIECTSCAGVWLPPAVFEGLCSSAEDAGTLRRALAGDLPAPAPVREEAVRYLPCVTCGERMMRRNFGGGSGVLIDVCKDHGVWFDTDELARALDWAERGGLERARARERERSRRQDDARREAAGTPLPRADPYDPWERRGAGPSIDLGDVVGALARVAARLLRR